MDTVEEYKSGLVNFETQIRSLAKANPTKKDFIADLMCHFETLKQNIGMIRNAFDLNIVIEGEGQQFTDEEVIVLKEATAEIKEIALDHGVAFAF